MTECITSELRFRASSRHELIARFDGGNITSDGGSLLLRPADDPLRLLERFAACFREHRAPKRVEHVIEELARQRVYGLALGYEDLVDHDELRRDPLLAAMVGKRDSGGVKRRKRDQGHGLAGSVALNRLELSRPETAAEDRYRRISLDEGVVDTLLVDVFLESNQRAPKRIVLDLDATDDPRHGEHEGRFFNVYCDCYCYMPLYIFCGKHLSCPRLRTTNQDGAVGSLEELERIVKRIRGSWPKVQIVVRADSGFCSDWLLSWCKDEGADYIVGLARNARLEERSTDLRQLAAGHSEMGGRTQKIFGRFWWTTRSSWSRQRVVIAKPEHSSRGANPRFIVTSLACKSDAEARRFARRCTAFGATLRTASRSSRCASMPTARARQRFGPTRCGSTYPQSPTC